MKMKFFTTRFEERRHSSLGLEKTCSHHERRSKTASCNFYFNGVLRRFYFFICNNDFLTCLKICLFIPLFVLANLPTCPLLPEHYPAENLNKTALLNESQIK